MMKRDTHHQFAKVVGGGMTSAQAVFAVETRLFCCWKCDKPVTLVRHTEDAAKNYFLHAEECTNASA